MKAIASGKQITPGKKYGKGGTRDTLADKLQVGAMMFPSVLFLAVFSIYPIFWVLKFMFYDFDDAHPAKFVGLANFVRLFTRDDHFWQSVWNTLVYGGGKILITIPLAFILALLLNESLKGRDFVRASIFMPTIISTSVVSMMFYYILNPYNGILNILMQQFGIIKDPINWLGSDHAMTAAILVAVWSGLGNYMIYFIAGLQGIPREVYESASIDGANKLQTIWYITIPMLGPVMQIIIMLAITNSLKGYESIMVLTGGGPAGSTEVMFLYVYRLFFPMSDGSDFRVDYGYGATASFISALIVGIITCAYLWYSKKLSENE